MQVDHHSTELKKGCLFYETPCIYAYGKNNITNKRLNNQILPVTTTNITLDNCRVCYGEQ